MQSSLSVGTKCNCSTTRSFNSIRKARCVVAGFVLLGVLSGPTVIAGSKTWVGPSGAGGNGNWNTAAFWSPAGVPGPSDDAILPTYSLPYVVTVGTQGGNAGSLTVEPDVTLSLTSLLFSPMLNLGSLNVADGALVELRGSLIVLVFPVLVLKGCATSTIDGEILIDGFSTLKIATCNHRLEGAGRAIVAGDIVVKDGVTLTNDTLITLSNGKINADVGAFDNSGTVIASGGSCKLVSGTFLGGPIDEPGTYQLAAGTLELSSGVNATRLAAHVRISGGMLDVRTNVFTTGQVTFTGGTIRVAAGKYFAASQ